MATSELTIFWHRRDLRTVDNRGLDEAIDSDPVLPVYIIDPKLVKTAGTARTKFFADTLDSLQSVYESLGTQLLIEKGDPRELVADLVEEFEAVRVVWNKDHSQFARSRDTDLQNRLPSSIRVDTFADMTVHEPGTIQTTSGDHYIVFSYYYDKWDEKSVQNSRPEPESERFVNSSFVERPRNDGSNILRSALESPIESETLPAGRQAAMKRLETFLDGPIYEYADSRDYPATAGTSRLSQDFSFGLVGPREVYEAVEKAYERAQTDAARESVVAFQRQIAWRDFYVQVLAAHPETVTNNFKEFENPIEWKTNPAHLTAWKEGKTGYPIVDAGMRQLHAEAYMHNRVRMIVASFLTKDLQIDWRKGYRWFRRQLLDHDTANEVGGWQWAASTGTDAQPYFRIFNPMTQGERYDPHAEYIRTYVPELADVAAEDIHSWTDIDRERRREVAPNYPDPIVDHSKRRKSTIEMFEQARGKTN